MDILDEIDAQLHEKKSKWSYTPMREKSETDAIIDDLLREFAPESSVRSHSSAHFAVKCRERLLATTGLRPHAEVLRPAAVVEKHRENFRGTSG